MRRFVSILSLTFVSLPAALAAGGIVVDPSGRPVPNARVECAGQVRQTGDDGSFSFPEVPQCAATVRANGFETTYRQLGADTERIELTIARLSDRVVVSATRRETSIEEAGAAATVITAASLESRQTSALADVLREVAGLEVSRYGRPGSLTQLYARGGERTGTLVLIDGVPVNDPGGELNLAGFSTNGLERIEVVRGPESALFGAEASAAVVQLFTRRGDPENRLPRGSLSYERGSFQTDLWRANLAGGAGSRLDYSLAAEQFHAVGAYPNDYFRNTTGTADVGFRITDSTQVRGVFRTFDSMAGTPNQVAYGLVDTDANEATRDSLVSVRIDDVRGPSFVQHASFGYHRSHDLFVDSQGEGPFDVAALLRDVSGAVPRVYFEGLTAPGGPVPPGMRLVTQSVYLWPSDPYLSLSSRRNAEYQGTYTRGSGTAVFGYAYERQDAQITGRDVARDNHAGFLHLQQTVGGRLFLSGGARIERNSAFGTKWTPRAAASYRVAGEHGPLSSTYLRLSAGVGITDPSLLQNYARDPYFAGNPSLKPEHTTSYDAGIVQEWFGRRLRTDASVFTSSFQDLIAFVFLPFPQPATWQNIQASRARGLEFSAQGRITSRLSVSGSYTRLWTRVTKSNSPNTLYASVGQELPRRPGNSGAFSVTFAPRRWTAMAGAVLVGERQDTNLFGATRNPAYQNVYASGSWRMTKNLVPFIRVENLLNQYYEEVLGYPALRRNVHGGIRVEW